MKKLDKFILQAFLGPFLVALPVVVFIFLVQTILKYVDELVGKDIGFDVFAELVFYFSLSLFPICLPLGVLLGSLIAFGNLGEHNELTAIKSSGISLLRLFLPVFIFIIGLTFFAFWFNNEVVPKVNLKAYSLLYDLRHKKPALDIKEGTFYNGLPGYSVKVAKKFPDGITLKGIIIYSHAENRGNTDVILADSGKMYTFNEERYLALDLYDGCNYSEQIDNTSNTLFPRKYIKTKFKKSRMVFDLASFELKNTEEGLFKTNKIMRNTREMLKDIDSLGRLEDSTSKELVKGVKGFFTYGFIPDSLHKEKVSSAPDTIRLDSLFKVSADIKNSILSRSVNQARTVKSYLGYQRERIGWLAKEQKVFEIARQQKYIQSVVCLLFFIIGAPLGAIIKKGGIGIPMIVCVTFFVIYYVISMVTEKWVRESESDINLMFAIWSPLYILLPIGLFFLRQARNDSRIFESDVYIMYFNQVKSWFSKGNSKKKAR